MRKRNQITLPSQAITFGSAAAILGIPRQRLQSWARRGIQVAFETVDGKTTVLVSKQSGHTEGSQGPEEQLQRQESPDSAEPVQPTPKVMYPPGLRRWA